MATQTADAPYIATNRPATPPPPPLNAKHYHIVFSGEKGKAVTQARWALG